MGVASILHGVVREDLLEVVSEEERKEISCLDFRGKSFWHRGETKEEIPRQGCLECKRDSRRTMQLEHSDQGKGTGSGRACLAIEPAQEPREAPPEKWHALDQAGKGIWWWVCCRMCQWWRQVGS